MGVQERRQRERDARRKAVLDATRTLVRQHGYNGTTTKEIAAHCELSEATLFWYFQSKEEIFSSLLFEAIEFMESRIAALAGAGEPRPPAQLVRELWSMFSELRSQYPEYFHVFTSLANPDATTGVSPEVKAELARRSGDNFRRVAELMDKADERLARVAVDVLWATFVGLGVLHDSRVNLGAPAHPSDHELGEALDLLLDGLASAKAVAGSGAAR
ncbi:MAG: TetR/AcrR family transcriptional regulator [Candidatus Nanopelagicales bacterium]|nr:TetR/AcrR family transcriptional regulator [Candidatus Nanopelagicales bacterium]MDZ4249970.1 TetR/AcrR family transcriptional regulator [Candidatus Nanopelagicales bacterium]